MIDPDRAILDGVFQPVADRLAGWLTCFAIARLFAYGQIIEELVKLAVEVVQLGWTTLYSMVLFLPCPLISIFMVVMINRAERWAARGRFNMLRDWLRVGRLLNLIMMSYLAVLWFFIMPPVLAVLDMYYSLSWIGILYFASCQIRPPKPRRQVARGALPQGA